MIDPFDVATEGLLRGHRSFAVLGFGLDFEVTDSTISFFGWQDVLPAKQIRVTVRGRSGKKYVRTYAVPYFPASLQISAVMKDIISRVLIPTIKARRVDKINESVTVSARRID